MIAYTSQNRMSLAGIPGRWVYSAAIAWLCLLAPTSDGKPAYVERIPNGNVFQCINCHTTAPNLNSFGRWFDDHEQLWDDLVATVDSDGDGATNGEELLDPNGTWRQGDTNPGSIVNVSNPGDAASKPAAPTATQTPTGTLVPTITPTPSNIPTITPTPSRTPTPTNTIKPTNTPKSTNTPTSTKTPTFTQTPTATITPTATAIPPRQVVIVGDAGTSGDTIHVIVAIDNIFGLAGGNITLRYNDEILTPGTPELGELLTSHLDANAISPINAAKSSGSYLSMAFASFDAVQSKGPGTIFSIPFKISSKAPTGMTVIDAFQIQLFDGSPQALSLESVPSSTIWINSGTSIDEWKLLDGNR